MKKQKHTKQSQNTKKPAIEQKPFSWTSFSVKILLLFAAVFLALMFTDKKGYFTAEQINNHIRKKWASFYNYTKTKEVDVIILGNSHIITGVDPFVLSDATSSICFILGNSGTGIIDAWFQLGEALKRTQPKLVVLETYCINNGEKPATAAIPNLQSFDAQKDVFYKLRCMPKLFHSDSWAAAWSPTIRNHSFLLTDMERIKYNIKNPKEPKSTKLDLGRFARFNSGLQDSTLAKYESLGAPVKGKEYQTSDFTKKYLQEIMQMCQAKNIPVLFVTVPMYYKHVSDYDVWKTALNEELKKYPDSKWLDLQMPYDTLLYTPEMFENTYETNQHLSNRGMMVTAYKLAEFIHENYPALLPDRSKDPQWINDFKDTDQFVYNQNIVAGTPGFSSIVRDRQVGDFYIKELVQQDQKSSYRLILKIKNQDNLPDNINIQCSITMQGANLIMPVPMSGVREIFPPQHKVYIADIRKDATVNGILAIEAFVR